LKPHRYKDIAFVVVKVAEMRIAKLANRLIGYVYMDHSRIRRAYPLLPEIIFHRNFPEVLRLGNKPIAFIMCQPLNIVGVERLLIVGIAAIEEKIGLVGLAPRGQGLGGLGPASLL